MKSINFHSLSNVKYVTTSLSISIYNNNNNKKKKKKKKKEKKKFTSVYDRLALEMNRCLQDAQVPDWITKGKTALNQKDPYKGTAPNNYRPITCLPMMWKILTAQIREKIYY